LFAAVSRAYDGDLQMVDSSSIRVHQHASNVKRGHGRPRRGPRCSPMHGRSRGGLTTKIHTVVDANGNPIALKLSEGQDGRSAADLLDSVGPNQILQRERIAQSSQASLLT
jgi:hypothetical protein